MSGSTIGGIVGGVVGWFVGGPAGAQWGFMIGSAVGAIVAPEQFEGPRLAEAKTQTANDGVPLIYGYGTFPCAGNLAWVDEVKEHRKKESAKGGPETITYSYTVSYMIVVCQGEISGYKLIKRNGKIVYDARTDAELSELGYSSNEIAETRANQAAFLQRATLYYGTQTQMPDPTMVAVEGAGNVPAYTGIAYIVMKDDETREGEVSQYEFVVANCGERTDDDSGIVLDYPILVTGSFDSQDIFAVGQATGTLSFDPIPASSGLGDISPSGTAVYGNGYWMSFSNGDGTTRYSSGDMDVWIAGSAPVGLIPIDHFYGNSEFIASNGNVARSNWPPSEYSYVGLGNVLHIGFAQGWYYYNRTNNLYRTKDFVNTETLHVSSGIHDDFHYYMQWQQYGPYVYATRYQGSASPIRRYQLVRSLSGLFDDTEVVVDNGPGGAGLMYWMNVVGGELVVYKNFGLILHSGNGFSTEVEIGVGVSVSPGPLAQPPRKMTSDGSRLYFLGAANDVVAYSDDLVTFTLVETGQSSTESIVSGVLTGQLVPIPDSPGFFIEPVTGQIVGPSGTQVDVCRPTLGQIVADQCDRRGVVSRDVSELADDVGGYRVAAPSTPQRNIQGLQPGYFFGASEFDGVLHFPKRGRPLTFALTHDDFVERDGDPIQWERTQEPELLRKVTVGYVDPETTYTATTQMAERRAATISAEGESTIELAVTGSKGWAAQAADKSIKVAWGEPDECTFHVSIEHAELVTGAEGTVPYMDGTTTAIRIDRIEDEGLVRMVTGRRTRANLYESNASGIAKPLPRFPGSSIRGPSDGVLLNIPVLIDADDRPGIHWAASRMLSGWQGTQLQIRRAGQWMVAGTVSNSAGMGTLLDPLPAHAGNVDTANVLRVRMNEDVESVTWVNLLQERNPFAIVRTDGTAEIIQAQTATAIAPGEFELTTLLRGRLATTTSDHPSGARIVYLDQRVQYATLEPTDVGTTLEYRFVSVGTDPDAAPIQTLELTTMESQREWPVADLAVEVDGDDYTLTWLRRDRLGTDVLPIRSANWAGYEVVYSWSGGSGSVVVTAETHTFTLPGASGITFSVAQLNQFTGAGPAQTVTVP